jgi:SAM-dependent methyltransferase
MLIWNVVNKSLNLLARLPGLGWLLNAGAPGRIRERIALWAVLELPDRRYMEDQILPAMREAGWTRILFVGCGPYTASYPAMFAETATEFWTIDLAPEAEPYGSPGRHIVGDCLDIGRFFPARHFDAVLLNGVFGYGTDDIALMNRLLDAVHGVLKPDGLLLIGWNRGVVPDPCTLGRCGARFTHEPKLPLPVRTSFEVHTHVYDFFRARA